MGLMAIKSVKILLISLISIIVTVSILLFISTTQPILKHLVVPIIEKSADVKINFSTIQLSLLKGNLKTTDFSYKANDNSYDFNTKKADLALNLRGLFNNAYIIHHLTIENSELILTENNTASTDETASSSSSAPTEDNASAPLYLDINNANIRNFNITFNITRKNKSESSSLKVVNLDLAIPKLETDGNGKLLYNCTLKVSSQQKNSKDTEGEFAGNTELKLDKDSYPTLIKSNSIMTFLGQKTPINIALTQQTPQNRNKTPFKLTANLKNLSLMPFFKAFVKGSYSNSDGYINNLDLNITGRDIENINFKRNISGELKILTSNIEIPSQFLDYYLAKIIFLPIYIIAHLNDYLSSSEVLPSQITQILGISNSILDGAKEFNFRTGDINLGIDKGIVDIRTFKLKGGRGCAIREMDSEGYIDLNNEMNLRTSTNITGIIVPLKIEGTLNKPDPQVKRMLPAVVGKTAENLIKSGAELGINIGKKLGTSAGKFIKDIPKDVKQTESE